MIKLTSGGVKNKRGKEEWTVKRGREKRGTKCNKTA